MSSPFGSGVRRRPEGALIPLLFPVPPAPAILVLIPAPHLPHLGGGQAGLNPLGAPHALLHHFLPLGGLLGRGNGVPGYLGAVFDVEMSHQKAYRLDHKNTSLPSAALHKGLTGHAVSFGFSIPWRRGLEERKNQG